MSESASDAVSNPNHHADFISSLPDVILHLILSHIETKFAIRTSVLSKRWKHVWSETPSISIDSCGVDPSSIYKTLSTYTAPKITSFDLSIIDDVKVTPSQIDNWIDFAISHNAENLFITILQAKYKYKFQDSFFINPSVKQLTVNLRSYGMSPTCIVSWTSLRSLSLNYCKLKSISTILSGCPMLESLRLNICERIYHLDLSKSPRLTRLDIYDCNLLGPGPMEIVAPHIHYLRYRNSWKLCNLVDVSSLIEANLNLYYFPFETGFDFMQDMVLKMLAKLQNIEKLTIGAIFLQILSVAELCGVPIPQLKIKALVVETMIVRSVIPGITRLLKDSPRLKKITIFHTMKCNAISDEKLDGYLNAKGLNPKQCWNGFFPTVAQTSSSSDGIAKEAKLIYVASFMELVLQNAKTLETVVLRLGGYLSATEYQKLLLVVGIVSSGSKTNSFKIIP